MRKRVRWPRACAVALAGAVASSAAIPAATAADADRVDAPAPARDPWIRPFSSASIWNTPIGSDAEYVDAGLPEPELALLDPVIVRRLSAADPVRPLLQPGDWRDRCSGTTPTGVEVPIPDDLIIPDAEGDSTPNHVAALLDPDGRTLINTNTLTRCEPGGPIYGWQTGNPAIDRTDLYGDGQLGGHHASRLSGIGGIIRSGELSGDEPITHVLDLLVWGNYLHWDGDGYRWPAVSADGYAADRYLGSNPETQMGSLLAIPPWITPEDLGVTTDVGLKIFAALQDYGGYVTDDAAWDASYVSVEDTAIGTFPWDDAEQDDMERIFDILHVVTNNGPESVGGGGTPRRPLLPEIDPDAPRSDPVPHAGGTGQGDGGRPETATFVVTARRWLGLE